MPRTPRDNPYSPNAGVEPPELAGRERELAAFRLLLQRLGDGLNEQSMIVVGVRGVGKTVLLGQFEIIAQEEGWHVHQHELSRAGELAATTARAVAQMLKRLDRKRQLSDALAAAWGALASFVVTVEGVELRVEHAPEPGVADSGSLAADLRDLLLAAGAAGRDRGTGLALLFDELHLVARAEYEALLLALHRVNQKNLPVAMAGAGLPLLPALIGQVKSYAERMFTFPRLAGLSDRAATEALVVPAQRRGVRFDDEAVNLILTVTENYPFFLQVYAKHAWAAGSGDVITADQVRDSLDAAQAYLDDSFFSVRFGKLGPGQRRFLVAMAHLGDANQPVERIAARLGKTLKGTSPVRDSLIKANLLCVPERGKLDFTVPHSADYIRRALA